jgi:hypothetical protein
MTTKHTPSGRHVQPFAGGDVLAARAAFVQKGTSLSRWCRQKGLPRSSVVYALAGAVHSPEAKRLRRRALKAAGLLP